MRILIRSDDSFSPENSKSMSRKPGDFRPFPARGNSAQGPFVKRLLATYLETTVSSTVNGTGGLRPWAYDRPWDETACRHGLRYPSNRSTGEIFSPRAV